MIWPSQEAATWQIFAGTLDLPQRSPNVADAKLAPLSRTETALPETPTSLIENGLRIERIRPHRLELGTLDKYEYRSRRMIPSAPLPSCGISRQCREMNGKSASRRSWLFMHGKCLLAAGSLRAWRRERSVSSWMGSHRCSRFLVII